MRQNMTEYLQEELGILPSKNELDDLLKILYEKKLFVKSKL